MQMEGMERDVLQSRLSIKQESSTVSGLSLLVTEINKTEYNVRKQSVRLEKNSNTRFTLTFSLCCKFEMCLKE